MIPEIDLQRTVPRVPNGPGFYKQYDTDVVYGPNFVLNKDYELKKEDKDTYQYPVDGWYWFETEEEAYTSFGLELPKE